MVIQVSVPLRLRAARWLCVIKPKFLCSCFPPSSRSACFLHAGNFPDYELKRRSFAQRSWSRLRGESLLLGLRLREFMLLVFSKDRGEMQSSFVLWLESALLAKFKSGGEGRCSFVNWLEDALLASSKDHGAGLSSFMTENVAPIKFKRNFGCGLHRRSSLHSAMPHAKFKLTGDNLRRERHTWAPFE